MHSKLARETRQAQLAEMRKLTPGERLEAFLTHCRLVAELHDAGRQRSQPGLLPQL